MTHDLFSHLPHITKLDTIIPQCCFGKPRHQLVVSVLVITAEGDLALIEPRYAPVDQDWLIPMQEKAKQGVDPTFGSAVLRGLSEELGLSPDKVTLHPTELSRYKNHVPGRRGRPSQVKYIIVYGARLAQNPVLSPNPAEVGEVVTVSPDDLLDCLPPRLEKFCGIVESCEAAMRAGLLSRTRWGDVLPAGLLSRTRYSSALTL